MSLSTLTRSARHLVQSDAYRTLQKEKQVLKWAGIAMLVLAILGIASVAPDIKRYFRMKTM